MEQDLTLPELEHRMQALEFGESISISQDDFLRLFGANDAAHGRLMRFVRAVGCSVFWTEAGLQFCRSEQQRLP